MLKISPESKSGSYLKAKPGITIQTGCLLSGVFFITSKVYKLLTQKSAREPNSAIHKERLVLYSPTKGDRLWGSLRAWVMFISFISIRKLEVVMI